MWAFAVVRASRQVSDLEFRLYSVLLDFDRHGLGMFVRDPAFIADEIGCAPAHVDRLLRSLRRKGLAASTSVTTATGVRTTWYPALPFALGPVPDDTTEQRRWRRDHTHVLDQHITTVSDQNRDVKPSSAGGSTLATTSVSAVRDDSLEDITTRDDSLEKSGGALASGETHKQPAPQERAGARSGEPVPISELLSPELLAAFERYKRRKETPR